MGYRARLIMQPHIFLQYLCSGGFDSLEIHKSSTPWLFFYLYFEARLKRPSRPADSDLGISVWDLGYDFLSPL
jgi:hypothetical protein